MDAKQISRISAKYHKYSIWLTAGATLLLVAAMSLGWLDVNLAKCLAVSAVYTVAVAFVYGLSWRHFAKLSPGVMARFYLAASALRLVMAALVVLAFCLLVQERDTIIGFVFIFFAFYVMMLIFDSVFFARIEKCNNQKTEK